MSNTDKIMQRFLAKIHSAEVRETFELLEMLMERLETKNDPEMFEIHLVNVGIQALENLSLLNEILKEQNKGKLSGNKLQRLYDNHSTSTGSQVLFD